MARINLLDTRTTSFGDLIGNGKIYRVPSFQRDYSWNEENWEDLWQDVLMLHTNLDSSHYMGALVLQRNRGCPHPGSLGTEKLNIKGMTRKAKKGSKRSSQKTGLNRSILDTGWGMLRSCLSYKLSECNGVFVEVPTQKVKPSQTCPNCGHQEKKTLAQRIHECKECGYLDDRDIAAAKVMLSWALGTSALNRGEESSTEKPATKHCGGFQQLSSSKRQKLQSSA